MSGAIKNKVYRDVMSNKFMIKNAKDFAEYASKTISGITSIYMSIYELLTEPDNIENAPKIPETFSIDKRNILLVLIRQCKQLAVRKKERNNYSILCFCL